METTLSKEEKKSEEKYYEISQLFTLNNQLCQDSLEQPSSLKIVDNITTYSSYDDLTR